MPRTVPFVTRLPADTAILLATALVFFLADADASALRFYHHLPIQRPVPGPVEKELIGNWQEYIENYRLKHEPRYVFQEYNQPPDFSGNTLSSRELYRPADSQERAAVESEDSEIDRISEDTRERSAELRSDDEPQFRSGETPPVVLQKLPELDIKQQRAAVAYAQHGDRQPVQTNGLSDFTFLALVTGCSVAAIFGVIAAGFCWYKFQKNAKAAAEAEYPAYGVTGPNKDHISPSSGDRKLAQSAQMYHYQHQKQQMIALEKASSDRHVSTSDLDSEEENEEGDYTVYECPGLAPTGEMEVKNPLFQDEPTPASPPVTSKEMEK